jgi:hypothetical protein
MTKIAEYGSESGSISQRHGSADPELDLDPHQNGHGSATLDVHIIILNRYGDKRTVSGTSGVYPQ